MRRFALVVLDYRDNIIDKINIDYISGISGLGFTLSVDTIDTDLAKFVSQIKQDLNNVTLKIIFDSGYIGNEALRQFFAKNISNTIALEYYNTIKTQYADIKPTSMSWAELDAYKHLDTSITVKTLTPFYEIDKNIVRQAVSSYGKQYPLSYPYSYGTTIDENNEITNAYIEPTPLIVSITGTITDPVITMSDDDGVYNAVSFTNTYLAEGEELVINSHLKTVYKITADGDIEDWFYNIKADSDKYLYAKSMVTSKISINLEAGDTGVLTANMRRYTL